MGQLSQGVSLSVVGSGSGWGLSRDQLSLLYVRIQCVPTSTGGFSSQGAAPYLWMPGEESTQQGTEDLVFVLVLLLGGAV